MSILKNKAVMITGASSGFGAAAAVAFAKEGCRLILGARRTAHLQEVAAVCREAGAPEADFHFLDVSSTTSVREFFHSFSEKLGGKLDLLINNAGGAHGVDFVENGMDADWTAMMESNVLGVLRMCREAIPLLRRSAAGHIINIGSVAGRTAYEGAAAYCAAKAGELQITRALRLELNGTPIRVGTLDPGLAETEFAMVRFKGDEERAKKVYQGMTPLNANDIAETLVWMASRPPHVCIDEVVIKPTDQASIHKVYRRV